MPRPSPTPQPLFPYLAALGGVALTTVLIRLVPGADHVGNISLLYLLVVLFAAYVWSSGPAILTAISSALAFDWFFVAPRYTLSVSNAAEWLALFMFLLSALVVSQLTHHLRLRAGQAKRGELETAALARVSWAVASQVSSRQTLDEVLRQTQHVIGSEVIALLIRGEANAVEVVALPRALALLPDFASGQEAEVLTWIWAHGRAVPGDELPFELEVSAHYLPIVMEGQVLGALYLWNEEARPLRASEKRVVESLVNQAAVALERDRLSVAQAAAEALLEADKLKSALLSMVSHDFRSPLAAIKASVTGLLQDGAEWDAASQRELLMGIDVETDRLNRMVGDILALSRLEAGAWRPQCELVPVAEVVGAALDAFSDEENRRIRVQVEPGLPEVALDSVQIVQVLHNLLGNALKYSPGRVELDARREGKQLVFEVCDCGSGLPGGEEDAIFGKFYRAKQWRESAVPGSGLGLTICRGLVEAHGGTLTARNREGGGAIFCTRLPILDFEEPEHTVRVRKTRLSHPHESSCSAAQSSGH